MITTNHAFPLLCPFSHSLFPHDPFLQLLAFQLSFRENITQTPLPETSSSVSEKLTRSYRQHPPIRTLILTFQLVADLLRGSLVKLQPEAC